MRAAANAAKIHRFMAALGERARGAGCVYLTGGATALLHGWRDSTVDVDLKADPEPAGLFEAIEPALIRFPAITPTDFRARVEGFCRRHAA